MFIHIDASRALSPQATGVNLYAREIIEHLPLAVPTDQFILYAPAWLASEAPKIFPQLPANCQWKFLSWPPRWLWTQICLAWVWARAEKKNSVFFCPAHVAPFFAPANLVVTVHDVAFALLPAAYSWCERWFARILTARNVSCAQKILVPSRATAQDLQTYFQVASTKIVVTPFALPCVRQKIVSAGAVGLEKFNLQRPFVLFVGRLEYKKGVDILVRDWARVRVVHDVDLVLVGKQGIGYEAIKNLINNSPVKNFIHELGYVSDVELNALYRAAKLFVLPSRAEGFGFNPLEAMAAGLPVVASAAGSIPEVVGEAAYLVADLDKFYLAINEVLGNSVLAEKLKQAGAGRGAELSWEKTIQATAEIIKSLPTTT